jgi:hypothetical protein
MKILRFFFPSLFEYIEELEARVDLLETYFDDDDALVSDGVATPNHGVGAKGFNVTHPGDDGSGEFRVYMTGKSAELTHRGKTYTFVNGILVDPEETFVR